MAQADKGICHQTILGIQERTTSLHNHSLTTTYYIDMI